MSAWWRREDWLNDAAKGFVPRSAGYERYLHMSNLDVSVADAPTLLAMKCAASRSEEDARDIRTLCSMLHVSSAAAALAIVSPYYPPGSIPVRTQLLLDEIFRDERA